MFGLSSSPYKKRQSAIVQFPLLAGGVGVGGEGREFVNADGRVRAGDDDGVAYGEVFPDDGFELARLVGVDVPVFEHEIPVGDDLLAHLMVVFLMPFSRHS